MTSGGPPGRRPSRRQQQADSTRRQLIDGARDVFEERGYRATTIRAITERAATAQGTFYLHFDNKEEAFGYVLAEAWQELYAMRRWEWEGDPREIVRSAVRSVMQVVAVNPGLSRALVEGALDSETVQRRWMESRYVLVERVAELIEREQRGGRARPCDPLMVASALGAMAEWTALTSFALAPGPDGPPDLETLVDSVADVWYHAMYGAVPEP